MQFSDNDITAAIAYLDGQPFGDRAEKCAVLDASGRERYLGPRADETHGVWSITKTFATTALGLLLADGKATLDTRAADLYAPLAEQYPALTLRHLASMTSGYRAVGDETPINGYAHGPSRTPFLPETPLFAPPGSAFAYWDSAMNLFAFLLTRLAGEPLHAFVTRRVADPAEFTFSWGTLDGPEGPVNGGAGNHGADVKISARQLARYGLVFLRNGAGLISADWAAQATACQVSPEIALGHPYTDGRGHFGFGWWTNRPFSGVYAARGHNNNALFVWPEKGLVVARLGLDQNTDGRIPDRVWERFLRRLAGDENAAPLPAG